MKVICMYEAFLKGEIAVAVVGLGYVGLPLAVAFSERGNVIGYDTNEMKIDQYKQGIDPTQEIGERIVHANVLFTSEAAAIKKAKFIIIAVPTPIHTDKTPDLTPVLEACRIVGQQISKGSIVVFESTVYPGVTEEYCVPILEEQSGLVCGKDFKVGYSPERINPGDKEHPLRSITKIVSGMDEKTLDCIAMMYELVIEAGVYRAQSIRVAEAAKLVENAQRDINIAFIDRKSVV